MAYALRGCGIVLKSDIDKRNRAFAQSGRTAGQPVVASLFIHSVVHPAAPAERACARARAFACARVLRADAGGPGRCACVCVLHAFAMGNSYRACETRRASYQNHEP
jgi:hypothetical protein